jgi:uncharacterized protein (DUF1778 family)
MTDNRDRPRVKTVNLTIRVSPEMRVLMEQVARAERRSVTNLFEILVERRAAELGIK